MANKPVVVNPIITERLNYVLKNCGKSGRWICENLLDNYASANFVRFTSGKSQIPLWMLDRIADHFKVDKRWLYGLDGETYKPPQKLIMEFTTDELLAEIKRRIEAP